MKPITYHYDTTHDIHVCKVHEASRAAVDAYVELVLHMASNIFSPEKPEARYVRILLDFSEARLFPLKYLQKRIKEVFATLPVVPPAIYIAYVTSDMVDKSLIIMLNYFSTVRKEDIRQVFSPKDYQKAIDWLSSKEG